jgi:hypothetical protein
MGYTKTEWKARQGYDLNKYRKTNETPEAVTLENIPVLTEPGTYFTAERMNHIEQGIEDAHTQIEEMQNNSTPPQ